MWFMTAHFVGEIRLEFDRPIDGIETANAPAALAADATTALEVAFRRGLALMGAGLSSVADLTPESFNTSHLLVNTPNGTPQRHDCPSGTFMTSEHRFSSPSRRLM